jgi:hypothetical protein
VFLPLLASGQVFVQQGSKLVGSGAAGNSGQGSSVALSADGKTALVGASADNSHIGAAWVFTQDSNGNWTQQGNKLVGTGYMGSPLQGISVALSSDGNTAIVGGDGDTDNNNNTVGAAWVFTRDGSGNWTQQAKLVGTFWVGSSLQGISVALSSDGNTALVGGANDNGSIGAAWVFTRSNGTWTQQGGKLTGSGSSSGSLLGSSVALSGDGGTALVGGYGDNGNVGAAWVFTRDGSGNWTQQGSKLVGTGAIGSAFQGFSVALSNDGNTALVGGKLDNSNAGAVWVFGRNNGTWTQEGNKLVGTGAVGAAQQGASVALSGDGVTAFVGGPADNTQAGAMWVFGRDPNGNWIQKGGKLAGSGAVGAASQGSAIALSRNGNTGLLGAPADNGGVGAAWPFALILIGNGIGGYDFASAADRAFAFDYNGSGHRDHIVVYRPGTGIVWILHNNGDGTFSPVYQSSYNASTGYGSGIGGYDLRSSADRMFAFDYDGTGKADHLVLYRPGSGIIWILANNSGTFTPVYQSSFDAPSGFGGGIGGYDLRSSADLMLAFDYTGGNTPNYILAYRPGSGIAWILGRSGGSFAPVYQSTYNATAGLGGGIAGYDLFSASDRIVAGDSTFTLGTGNSGELVLYRPSSGIVWVLKSNGNGTFAVQFQSTWNPGAGVGGGIGGYDLRSSADQLILASTPGSSNGYALLYRPGAGIAWTEQCTAGTGGILTGCAPVYQSGYNFSTGLGAGIAGYDLFSGSDRIFTLDYSDSGALDHLVVYRPGTGIVWILQNSGSSFSAVYP